MTTILIVDDIPMIRELLAETLRAGGYDTICAENGREALSLVKAHSPDLVLLDMTMPVMDGLAYLQAAQADPANPRPPVVLLTDAAERRQIIQAARLGAQDYLLKSHFSPDTLLTRIKQHLSPSPSQESPCSAGSAPDPKRDALPQPMDAGHALVRTVSSRRSPSDSSPPDSTARLNSIKPLMQRAQLKRRLAACAELKALSPIATDILRLTDTPDTSIETMTQAISRDPAIALKILQLSNSAAFARGKPVDSIDQAVIRIGMGTIRRTVLSISVIDQFTTVALPQDMHPLQFWEHSIACGLIAAQIADARRGLDRGSAFTMGLLHDVGRMLFAQLLGERYAEVVSTARDLRLPLEQVESRLLSLNHAEAMDTILRAWRFPKDLIDPIVHHHSAAAPFRAMALSRAPEVATLMLANQLAHSLLLGSSGNETIYPTDKLCRELQLEPSLIQRIEESTPEQTSAVKISLLSVSAQEYWPQRRDHHRSELHSPLRPIFVSATPQTNAYRILCDQLRHSSHETPNVGVIHLMESSDRAALMKALTKAEAEAGVENIPLLILSSTGQVEDQLAANRCSEFLCTPVTVPQFVECLYRLLAHGRTQAAA